MKALGPLLLVAAFGPHPHKNPTKQGQLIGLTRMTSVVRQAHASTTSLVCLVPTLPPIKGGQLTGRTPITQTTTMATPRKEQPQDVPPTRTRPLALAGRPTTEVV